MDRKEFESGGSLTVKKLMLSSWAAVGSLCALAFGSPIASSKNIQAVLLLVGAFAALIATALTLVYWSTLIALPPLDSDGRMPLPKESKLDER